MSEQVLQQAYDKVLLINQRLLEAENAFADRLTKTARDCANGFNEETLVHHYVRGLLPTTREKVGEDVRRLPKPEKSSLTSVRRLAEAAGATYRGQFAVAAQALTAKRKSTSSLYMGALQGTDASTASAALEDRGWGSATTGITFPPTPELDSEIRVSDFENIRTTYLGRDDPEATLHLTEHLESILVTTNAID